MHKPWTVKHIDTRLLQRQHRSAAPKTEIIDTSRIVVYRKHTQTEGERGGVERARRRGESEEEGRERGGGVRGQV